MTGTPAIYLASQSPRRRELLRQIGVTHVVLPVAVDERRRAGESAHDYVVRVALAKACAGRAAQAPGDRSRPVLGADTGVVIAGEVLGKPADRDTAMAMLQRLSGTTHEVLSAVALAGASAAVRVSISRVTFRTLTERECAAYWQTGEPVDKAGAYAIQGRAAVFVTRIEGSYSGVMGLPLYETAELLKEFGITVI